MGATSGDAGESDRSEPPSSTTAESRTVADDFYRGAGATAVRRSAPRSPGRDERDAFDRPPRWVSVPLRLVAVATGFVAFSTVWGLLGDGVFAVPLAVLVAVVVWSATMRVGDRAWNRLTDGPPTAG